MVTDSQAYYWQPFAALIKRFVDVFVSLSILIMLWPLYLLLIVLVAFTSGLPVFYSQERVGKNGRPFRIYKFRTMQIDAETNGPQLSQEDDERVIGIGRVLRKWRLDELPQFVNVLLGDMSLVGPRPERYFYVNQLKESVPDYEILFSIQPGITSAGMVNFGYASTVEEMQTRAQFDIDYVKNLSLAQDVKVVLQTVRVILEGSGK